MFQHRKIKFRDARLVCFVFYVSWAHELICVVVLRRELTVSNKDSQQICIIIQCLALIVFSHISCESQVHPTDKPPSEQQRRRNRSQHDRTQMDDENPAKRRKAIDSPRQHDEQKASEEEKQEADLHRHVHGDEDEDEQDVATLDAATTEESKRRAKEDNRDAEMEEEGVDSQSEQPMQEEHEENKENSDKLPQLQQEVDCRLLLWSSPLFCGNSFLCSSRG